VGRHSRPTHAHSVVAYAEPAVPALVRTRIDWGFIARLVLLLIVRGMAADPAELAGADVTG